MNKPIIVTALYDIDRDKWKEYNLSIDTYLYWMNNLLQVKNKIVCYTEKLKGEIEALRPSNIDIIELRKPVLYSTLKHFYELNILMNSVEFKNKVVFPQVPEMCEVWYNILMFNKLRWMLDASTITDGTHYVWVDAGCFRDEDASKYNVKWPNSAKLSDKPMFFSHNTPVHIYKNDEDHSLSQFRNIQGGCFSIPKKDLKWMCDAFAYKVEACIMKGYIGSDEKIFDLMWNDNKDKIKLIKSDWRKYFDILS
tara:strand:+ start:697 stop:1452 length:756 start_codon:yes stop_codon:yes gene_type:complete